MSIENASVTATTRPTVQRRRRLPTELSIFLVLVGIALIFEALGWIFVHQSFLGNPARLQIMILQVSVLGIIAVGVTQVIIAGGIDLSSGSVVGATAMVAASLAQSSAWPTPVYPGLVDLPFIIPIGAGLLFGLLAGMINGALIAYTKIPPFIATLGMMVSARGVAKWYTTGKPVSGLTEQFTFIGTWIWPVVVLLVVAAIFHVALRYTRYGKFTYAIGANPQAARVSGINIERHLVKVYAIAGLLAGLAGVMTAARAQSGQAGMGVMNELDAITMAVIGGTSLAGGRGSILGTVIGMIILGTMISGFTFLRVDAFYQEMIKGVIIVGAVVVDQYRQRRKK